MKVTWDKTRKLRSLEVVMGLIFDATDFHPISAMVWNTISNARRLMKKDATIELEAKRIFKLRAEREEAEYQRQKTYRIDPSNSGVDVEPDPSRPFGVGSGLSCDRVPMAVDSTGGSSALPAWQSPPGQELSALPAWQRPLATEWEQMNQRGRGQDWTSSRTNESKVRF